MHGLKNLRLKRILYWLIGVGVVLVVTYVGGGLYYQHHYLPNTTIDGVVVSNKDSSTAIDLLQKGYESKRMSFSENNQEIGTLTLQDIGINIDANSVASNVLNHQNEWLWPMALVKQNKIISEQENKNENNAIAEKILSKLNINNDERQASENATIQLSEDKTFEIRSEKVGTKIDLNTLEQQVEEQLNSNTPQVALDKCYEQPKITKENEHLKAELAEFQKIGNVSVTLSLGSEEIKIPTDQIQSWLYLDSDDDLSIDEDKVNTYLQQVNQTYSGLLTSHQFASTLRGEVTVQPGTYGWYIYRPEAVKQIVEAVKKGEDVTFTPSITGEGFNTDNFFGNTYVEVDLTNQKMFIYNNGELQLSTDIVSGKDLSPTVAGQFVVWNKESPSVLRGTNTEGVKYSTEVSYWMPFDYSGQGIHDASWQSTFGGSWYHANGSLGCINVKPSVMGQVYNLVSVGTPVIIF